MTDAHPPVCLGLDHIVLKISDARRSVTFYQEVLGLTLERVLRGPEVYQMRAGASLIDLMVAPAGYFADRDEVRDVDHVCLNVEGTIEPIVEHLAGHGVEPTFGPIELYGSGGYRTSVYLKDPDDYTIELRSTVISAPIVVTMDGFKSTLSRLGDGPQGIYG